MQLILLATTQLFSSTQRSAWRPNGFTSERKLDPLAVVVHDPQSGASRFMASGSSHSTTYMASLGCTTCIKAWAWGTSCCNYDASTTAAQGRENQHWMQNPWGPHTGGRTRPHCGRDRPSDHNMKPMQNVLQFYIETLRPCIYDAT